MSTVNALPSALIVTIAPANVAIPTAKGSSQPLFAFTKFTALLITVVTVLNMPLITGAMVLIAAIIEGIIATIVEFTAVNVLVIATLTLFNIAAIPPVPAFLRPASIELSVSANPLDTAFFIFVNEVPIPPVAVRAVLANPLTPPSNAMKRLLSSSTVILPDFNLAYKSRSADLPVNPKDLATVVNAYGIVSCNVFQLCRSTVPLANIWLYCSTPRLASPALAPDAKKASFNAVAV
ncbi:hypothetical protein WGH24286_01731 [Periweissella ghanensis]|uniref:Uncharacterized protein n=1 Tax=Periweissella ghanensis TaxID=467997 RepID=A0ABN8BR34_9LACO|nr:hypothetical protein WGH24286_01731 [Periweissella ghanensis]